MPPRADRRRPHCLREPSSFLFLLRLDGLVLVLLLAWLTGHPGGLVQVPVPARWLLLHGQSMRDRRTESKRRCPKGHGGFSRQPLRLVSSSVSCGATVNRSPTTPKSASSKIGASGSLLMATMVLDVCMPARCWIAPEIPTAMYNCGDTVTPVWPTCILCGTHPASVAARDAPTAAPRESASASMILKFSAPPTPRPPDTITDASVRAGRLPFASTDSSTGTATCSAAPGAGDGVTELARTVMTGTPLLTFDCTVTAPPKMLCTTLASGFTVTASVSTPLPILKANLAATSLCSGVEETSTAAGDACATTEASTSAFGATRKSSNSSL